MAGDKVNLVLVSPEKLEREQQVDMVVVPGLDGDIGVLPNHAPLLSALRAGTIAIFEAGKVSSRLFIADGFLEINQHGCTILAESTVNLDDADLAALEQVVKNRKDDLDMAGSDDVARNKAMAAHDAAIACLHAATHPAYAA
ncbi:MAG: ATP synthase F1 subunit epsilon [Alphaproteobacteria bacterium]